MALVVALVVATWAQLLALLPAAVAVVAAL
jgi:hypothetical protein